MKCVHCGNNAVPGSNPSECEPCQKVWDLLEDAYDVEAESATEELDLAELEHDIGFPPK